eukprot:TRINITY_DN7144_c0_g1_i1.p1 TRINITY_DN7144_c0_g1~~TRINITY_DN7144_c0_g1_i1.p1  ORF type:complete len:263 (-),score=21.11 TRINITY_DN7144_c0_g1_i1:232-993(-)
MSSTEERQVAKPKVDKEAVLKKRRKNEEWAAQKAIQHANKLRKIHGNVRKGKFIRAEELVQQYREREQDKQRIFKVTKQSKKSKYQLPQEKKVGFVIRLFTKRKLSQLSWKVFTNLGLLGVNEGKFFEVSKEISSQLDQVQPYVVWGYPSLQQVKELIYKRGQGRDKEQERRPLTDNAWIEEKLGQYGIICMEDLIHEIYTVGENFDKVNQLLWPFKLSVAKDEVDGRYKQNIKVGKTGNREEEIDQIINMMN